jgi:hypothetical protein
MLGTWLGGTAVPTSSHFEPADDERRITLAAINGSYPPWHAWEGVIAGLLYARRPNCSPPLVVRSTTAAGLRHEIERAEIERGLTR